MEDELQFVTYCGLYCELCAERSRIPRLATGLKDAMADEGWPYWGHEVANFAEFWAFLEGLKADGGCPGCRAGGGYPDCQIRRCARERCVELCAECADWPCGLIDTLANRYPMLVADNHRLQRIGRARWLDEQRERARRGVVYADWRFAGGNEP